MNIIFLNTNKKLIKFLQKTTICLIDPQIQNHGNFPGPVSLNIPMHILHTLYYKNLII